MSDRVELAEGVRPVLEPVQDTVQQALQTLPAGPPVRIELADIGGAYWRWDDGIARVSRHLGGPAIEHPGEEDLALDRWRRCVSCVLEAVALAALAADTGRTPDLDDWRWAGLAIDAADRAAPALELAAPELGRAIRTASPGSEPRAGAAVLAAWRALGVDPGSRAREALDSGVDLDEWLEIGGWILSPTGAAAALPSPVPRPDPVDIPVDLPPWSWARLDVPAHPRGGQVVATGHAAARDPWAVGGQPLRTLAGATDGGGGLRPEVGGPVGTWEGRSAAGFGQLFGMRGLEFVFRGSGRVEIVMADAFVGPGDAVEVAERVGTSGTATGRWEVAGSRALRFRDIVAPGLTMHGRDGDAFAVPATGLGMGTMLEALQQGTWSWRIEDDELWLEGDMLGGRAVVRLAAS